MITKRLIKMLLVALLLTASGTHVQAQSVKYLAKHIAIANQLSEKYGIPAPVILAVAMVESASGTGNIAKNLNNHFGIVGKNHLVNKDGTHKTRYKQYDSEMASYLDFCRLISGKKFYMDLKDSDDCNAWVNAISQAGYSTKPLEWRKKVLGTISANKL